MSISWSLNVTYSKSTCPFLIWYSVKQHFHFRWLVVMFCFEFFPKQCNFCYHSKSPKSSKKSCNQRAYFKALAHILYLASKLDSTISFYNLLCHYTSALPIENCKVHRAFEIADIMNGAFEVSLAWGYIKQVTIPIALTMPRQVLLR